MLIPRYREDCELEAGVDEAGRGCLAGPVVAAAVILAPGNSHPMLADSKKLSERQRNEVAHWIKTHALSWALGEASVAEIEKLNIVQASVLAMHRAIAALKPGPEQLIIDGNYFRPYRSVPHETLVKGDAKYQSIAGASILAKVHRDQQLKLLDKEFPWYQWSKNKGYPTAAHRQAIAEFGPCIHHRKSFKLLPDHVISPQIF